MYRVGSVVRTAQGLLILRSEDDNAEIGTMVLNDSLETVGRVVDVFGPVDRPYVAVTPENSVHAPALVGSALYAR
ncbi:Gar1/Naf1 family protein [Halobacteria archaeon AArc-m2/3/4]|uniref:Gar1/Naf1 family protein n=1 Tax=Natronoglomus mannanivorans TaxID=2979990 RepID=A0AAP2YW76_9EURY|nr:Gar1/Naf1 family protein [Halobacteria archaeon AArc-xg1-1]MCU4971389.1 Gar1/Naf1 family protein [Halobacteria archaeon AArc-m2/3/4]